MDRGRLERTKLHLAARRGVDNLTNREIAFRLASQDSVGLPPSNIDRFPDHLATVETSAVEEDHRRCLRGNPVVMITGDEASARRAYAEVWP